MLRSLFIALSLFLFATANAQSPIDVQHYRFELELSDNSDAITGKAIITTKFVADAGVVNFDLASIKEDKGFFAFQVKRGAQLLTATHRNDVISITLPTPARKGEVHTYEINYMGTPDDGLIISKNKYGDRTFFSDNWPNRAHQWIPCNDRPDDKASFEFLVKAPAHYKVISNGLLISEKKLDASTTLTHWKEETPLSTKIMVIGAAKFGVKNFSNSPKGLPVSAWIYAQDTAKGFYDYAVAVDILDYFSNYIAPFPFKKLANVQSKTIFGGMENASAIFYAEESVTGDRKWEDVIAHEIIHQWFGDAASEKSFAHLWLSEGFATYLTDIYIEKKYGKDSANKRLQKERQQVINFSQESKTAVVDSTSKLMDLLNANSYQKGAWVLHMLRTEVGDSSFQKIVREYYNTYKGSNAETRDFQVVVENVTGKNWKQFFDQWLYQPGVPILDVVWKGDKGEMKIEIKQTGNFSYQFPFEFGIVMKDGTQKVEKVFITEKETKIKLEMNGKPESLVLDPNTRMLFKATVKQD
jgi:aminopeptidase N